MWTVTRLVVLLCIVTQASQDHLPGSCVFEGRSVPDGARMTKSDPCHLCHCHGGRLECVWKHCGPPPPGCRTLETDNACNQTVYLCPLPEDNDNTSSSGSSETTTSSTTVGPYFSALTSSSPTSDTPDLTSRFPLLPPPLPSRSPLSSEGRQSSQDGSDEPGTGPTYFNEFSSAPMNFSAALGRGEGPRSPRRLTEGRGESAEEGQGDDRLHFSSPRPGFGGQSDEETSERTSPRTTERTTSRTLGRTSYRPSPRSSFRISRPRTFPTTERSETRSTLSTRSRTSTEALGRTESKSSSRAATWTTRTTPRARPWTTSPGTVRSSSSFPERNSTRPRSKPQLRFPKRPNSLLAIRDGTGSDENSAETTTRPSFRERDPEPLRATHHPILRPRIRPLSLAEPSERVRTTAQPEVSSVPITTPRRAASRPGRRQLKTLSTTRHRLQRLFPSTVRPETGSSSGELRSRELDVTTTKPEAAALPSLRGRVRPLPPFQSLISSNPIPRPRSRIPTPFKRTRSSPFSSSTSNAEDPPSLPTFQEASAVASDRDITATPFGRVPPIPSTPAAVALAAPVVSFDYDLEDDSIDLTEYEFPEFGRRLRREAPHKDFTGARGDIPEQTATARRATRTTRGERKASRLRRSLLPGDARHEHHEHHGHHDGHHPHHPDVRGRPDRHHHHGNHGHGASTFADNRLGDFSGIGDKRPDGVPSRSDRYPKEDTAEEDYRSYQPLERDQNEPNTCFVSGLRFKLGELIEAASDSCLECRCAGAAMLCYPKCCFYTTEEPKEGQTVHVLI